ncbi:SMI1/KNR4 family protein [Undibacterium sp. SXout11W]|nr:SMI1/KNR4 family protein [Undibacterium jejuense]
MTPNIPAAYEKFLKDFGGFEGLTYDDAEPGYVVLWPLEELSANNADIQMEELAPGYLAFGGDGGGEVLAFDSVGAVFKLPMIGLDVQEAIRIADDFSELSTRFDAVHAR